MVAPIHGTCLKCKGENVTVVYARKDSYCYACFVLFVKSKYRKAVDAFRLELPQGSRDPKMLLALSGGSASTALVDLVYSAVQRTRGRYEMPVVLHLDDTKYTGALRSTLEQHIDHLKSTYPEMTFLTRKMDDIDAYLHSPLPDMADSATLETVTAGISLTERMASLTSKTAQEDMLAIYRDRLLLETALEHGCQAILFGTSATSLAAKTLALTAKGRGYALPWETADHCLLPSGVWSLRPLKTLLVSEIQSYSAVVNLPILPISADTSGQPDSIDVLTQRYFESLETQFPSLVATVGRTTNKLVEPVSRNSILGSCKICGMSYQHAAADWLDNITVSEPAPNLPSTPAPSDSVSAVEVNELCYGCTIALRGVRANQFWPTWRQIQRTSDVIEEQ